MTFLYLIPTGMNDPEQPSWGSWGGRYGRNPKHQDRPYYWANRQDNWEGSTNRDNTLRRWASDLQNDFRARLDWCVKNFAHANHPPVVRVRGAAERTVTAGETVMLDASESSDSDGQTLHFEWIYYPEPGSYRGPAIVIRNASSPRALLAAPLVRAGTTVHLVLAVIDEGTPPLTRYQRIILNVQRR